MTTCRKCMYLVNPDGKRLMRDKAYQCSVELPVVIYPYSITSAYGYRDIPVRGWVSPDEVHECTFFEREDKNDRIQVIPQA